MLDRFSSTDQQGLAPRLKECVDKGEVSTVLAEAVRVACLPEISDRNLGYSTLAEIIKNPLFVLLVRQKTQEEVQSVITYLTYR